MLKYADAAQSHATKRRLVIFAERQRGEGLSLVRHNGSKLSYHLLYHLMGLRR
jgi:hypothetical protein